MLIHPGKPKTLPPGRERFSNGNLHVRYGILDDSFVFACFSAPFQISKAIFDA
jgi:hypothetical protein